MPNNEVDDFLSEVNKPEEDPFKLEEDTQTEDSEEDEPKEPVDDEEEKLPYHKDPKVQRFIQKEIEKATKGLKPEPTETQKFIQEVAPDEMDEVLNRIIGNDTPEKVQGVKDMKKLLLGLTGRARQEALQEIDQRQVAEEQAEQEAVTELEEGFDSIEEAFNVDLTSNNPQARKTRDQFIDYIAKIAPKNSDGEIIAYPDLPAAFEEFQSRSQKPRNASRNKDLASRGMQRSNGNTSTEKSKGVTWSDVDKIMDRLT